MTLDGQTDRDVNVPEDRAPAPEHTEPMAVMQLGNLTVDFTRYLVRAGARRVHLTYIEFETLRCFLDVPGALVTREELLRRVWGDSPQTPDTLERRLNLTICRLRQKLAASDPWTIATVHKRGYVLTGVNSEARLAPRPEPER